jgi:enoyl-CoA hydratase
MTMPTDDAPFTEVRYERPASRIARIVMNRPQARNAQGIVMTYELDRAMRRACHDDEVNVIILAGEGDHFSAGHDLSGRGARAPDPQQAVGLWGNYGGPGWEGQFAREKEVYLEMTERWRNAPKPTIAEIQGACIMGGNMLAWACDLIVCADDARFRDQAADFAMPGVEFFAHPWELGVRKAKEWLFTSDWLSAHDAEKLGMVNHVVPRSQLSAFTLELASRIAQKDRFVLKLIKESVNAAQDAMGRRQAMSVAFALHQVGHMQNMLRHGFPMDISQVNPSLKSGLEQMREDLKKGKD